MYGRVVPTRSLDWDHAWLAVCTRHRPGWADLLVARRRSELEKRLAADPSLPDDRRARQLAQLGRTESSFLRLRRTRLGLDDFKTVKVIGKGAFGEVSVVHHFRGGGAVLTRCTGPSRAKGRYGQDLRHEELEEGRDVQERSSESLFPAVLVLY